MNNIYTYKHFKRVLFALTVVLISSCGDFLDVKPKGMVMPENTKDYDEMMGNSIFANISDAVDFCASDDIIMDSRYISMFATMSYGKSYFWMDALYTDSEDDGIWNGAYSAIFTANVVMRDVSDSKGGTDADKKRLLAEAKIQRAHAYFILHYLYAPAYSAQTADRDISVPILTEPNLEAKPSRESSKQVIDLILEDIKDGDKYLYDKNSNPFRLKKVSANAIFARIYLYLGDYDKALIAADKVLAVSNKLFDFNTLSFFDSENPAFGVLGYPTQTESPEYIYMKFCNFSDITKLFAPSDELVALFDKEGDLRYRYQLLETDYEGLPYPDGKMRYAQNISASISVPEIMLIKAECLARKGDVGCLEILNKLRRARISESEYKPLSGSGKEQLLKIVLEERRRELMLNDMRWYDMKRLSKEGLYTKTLVRKMDSHTYTLTPNSPKYVFPIAPRITKLNPNIKPTNR